MQDAKRDYPATDERLTYIGDYRDPLLWLKRCEIPALFDDTFWLVYQTWRRFHWLRMLPNGDVLLDNSEELIDCVVAIEEYYQMHYSQGRVVIQYLEAMLKRG